MFRVQFEQFQKQGIRPPVHPGVVMSPRPGTGAYIASPYRSNPASPYAVPHAGLLSPQRILVQSPQRVFVPSPQRIHSESPASSRSARKRDRSESFSPSEYTYSCSDSEGETSHRVDESVAVSKPPSPPKYYPEQLDEDEEIDSSDSDYEEESVNSEYLEDLRDFIDFDPKYNKNQTSKRSRNNGEGDELDEFLFNQTSRPRKWFKAFAWNAVGPKLSRKPTPTRRDEE